MLLLIGSIALGYFINKTLNPNRAFSVGLTANTEATPTIVEEEPAFTMEKELDDEYVFDEEEIVEPDLEEEPLTETEAAPLKIWDDLEELQSKFNEAARLLDITPKLGEMTLTDIGDGVISFQYDFSETHKLAGIISPYDGSIPGVTIFIQNDETPDTLNNLLNTIHSAIAAANPVSEIDTNVEDIVISLLWDDSDVDLYNMDSSVETVGKTYSIESDRSSGIWFKIVANDIDDDYYDDAAN